VSKRPKTLLAVTVVGVPVADSALVADVRQLILDARQQTAQVVNTGLTLLYWQVGDRVRREILKEKRAEYGVEVLRSLSTKLEADFGHSFGEKNLRRMIQFAEVYPDWSIVVSLIRQLTWTHIIALLPMKDPLQRDFYAEMCRIERWSVRMLRSRVDSMLYERTALSKKPDKLVEQELKALREEDQLTPDLIFRDPYILDFLDLKDTYSEKDLENALLREMESFLLELGTGFAFVERQKRITLDGEDFTMDLLFFHRRLHRLVVVELKLGDFKPADLGQIQLYLNWLDRHERQPGEERPLGLILCAGKKTERVEYLDLDRDGVHLAEYLTALPPRELLQQRLHDAILHTRQRLEQREPELIAPTPKKRDAR
jgi:predicted nuclease of restriction endonuclease-like (RecB) superfamily